MSINSLLASKEEKEMKERNQSHLIGIEPLNILANTQTTAQTKRHLVATSVFVWPMGKGLPEDHGQT